MPFIVAILYFLSMSLKRSCADLSRGLTVGLAGLVSLGPSLSRKSLPVGGAALAVLGVLATEVEGVAAVVGVLAGSGVSGAASLSAGLAADGFSVGCIFP